MSDDEIQRSAYTVTGRALVESNDPDTRALRHGGDQCNDHLSESSLTSILNDDPTMQGRGGI